MVDREDPRALRLFFVHRGVAVAELFILQAPLHDGEFVGQARIYDRNQRAQTRPIDDTQVGTDRARAGGMSGLRASPPGASESGAWP